MPFRSLAEGVKLSTLLLLLASLPVVIIMVALETAFSADKWGNRSAHAVTAIAGLLAGRRHAHLREAWAADLHGDPESDRLPPGRRQMLMAAGFMAAALRCRLDDSADLAWRPVDALLSSRHGSNLATFLPVTIAAGVILSYEGIYGLVTNADNLGVIAAAPYASIKGLRKYRQISTPKHRERKGSSAEGPEQ